MSAAKWSLLGLHSRAMFTCEAETRSGERCKRKARWRWGVRGAMAERVVCSQHKTEEK